MCKQKPQIHIYCYILVQSSSTTKGFEENMNFHSYWRFSAAASRILSQCNGKEAILIDEIYRNLAQPSTRFTACHTQMTPPDTSPLVPRKALLHGSGLLRSAQRRAVAGQDLSETIDLRVRRRSFCAHVSKPGSFPKHSASKAGKKGCCWGELLPDAGWGAG